MSTICRIPGCGEGQDDWRRLCPGHLARYQARREKHAAIVDSLIRQNPAGYVDMGPAEQRAKAEHVFAHALEAVHSNEDEIEELNLLVRAMRDWFNEIDERPVDSTARRYTAQQGRARVVLRSFSC